MIIVAITGASGVIYGIKLLEALKELNIENPKTSILIDDYYKNIQNFYEQGGIGIKKTYSGKERPIPQVESLVDLFSVLFELNCMKK